jgi:Protein of unknown function (DUF3060)
MESQDDPEARIRDLERPLADRALASELGIFPPGTDPLSPPTRAYADPYPPPPPMTAPLPPMPPPVGYPALEQHGAPYPGPVHHTGSGFRGVGLIVAGVFVVGAVALATSIASFTEMFSEVRSVIQSGDDSASGDTPPGVPDTGVPPTASAPTVVAAGGQLSVSGVGEHRSIVCDGGAISVSGVDNIVELRGYCVNVTVSGVRNEVSIDSADVIGVSGFDNQVTYRSGSPEIGQSGGRNSVERG